MNDDILTRCERDPRGENMLEELKRQSLEMLSVADLKKRIAALKEEQLRAEQALLSRGDARAAADALFKS